MENENRGSESENRSLLSWIRDGFTSDSGHWLFLVVFFLLLGAVAVTLDCFSLSPIFSPENLLWTDGVIYMDQARMMGEGAIPYVDILDIKGPYLYWYSYIGYLIHTKYGFYLLQILSTSAALLLMYDTLRLMDLKGIYRWSLFTIFAAVTLTAIEGNNADDSFLVFQTLAIWSLVRSIKFPDWKNGILCGLADGLALGIQLFTRATNAAVPGVVALLLVILPLVSRDYKTFGATLCSGLFTLAVTVAIPFAVYASYGEVKALIDWNFIIPFTYVGGHEINLDKIILYTAAPIFFLVCLVLLLFFRKTYRRRLQASAIALLVSETIVALAGFMLTRHLRSAFPVYILALCWPFRHLQSKEPQKECLEVKPLSNSRDAASVLVEKKPVAAKALKAFPILATIAVFGAFACCSCLFYLTDMPNGYRSTKALREMGEKIPQKDKDERTILVLDLPSAVYENIGTVPDFPVPSIQSWDETFLPEIEDMVVDYVRDEASWVIVNDRPYEHPEITPIYQREAFTEVIRDCFTLRADLSLPGVFLTYSRI